MIYRYILHSHDDVDDGDDDDDDMIRDNNGKNAMNKSKKVKNK